jgi:ElaB/YqjD/DUF883 family membrane-anchored ribosome-binding protein
MKNHNRAETTAETPEQLIEHISQLMAEAEAMLAGPVSEAATSRISEIKSRLESAQEKLVDIYGSARRKVVAGAKYTDQAIRSHPYESLAIALGVGVLLGALLRRNNS